jgi:hypothetical protein
MIEFLRILFLGKMLLITPQPVDLDGMVEFKLGEPLTAITAGATLEIDVSSMISKRREEPIIDFRRRVDEAFPAGTVEATLFGENVRVEMPYTGNYAYSDAGVTLLLQSKDGVPTGVEFSRLTITSQSTLRSIAVRWRNHQL